MNYELTHYGVQGMKWGVKRSAKKDAREFARAKMFYGEGAGTRRKLIKAKVESKSKDENYKKAFDHYFAKQDLGKHASAAKTERRVKDVTNTTKKTGRGIINIINGNPQAASAVAVGLVAVAGAAHKAGVDKMLANQGKKAYSFVRTEARTQQIKRQFKNFGVV